MAFSGKGHGTQEKEHNHFAVTGRLWAQQRSNLE